MTIEICFYVHGVSDHQFGAMHTETYRQMHEGIREYLPPGTLWPEQFAGAEWGWNFDGGVAESHKALVTAQRIYGAKVMDHVDNSKDVTVNPLRAVVGGLRSLMLHGFGDMFYYVSAEGKWAVRYAVATQLAEHVKHRRGGSDEAISLTLLGHSAGSVIAFDFAFYLFNERPMFSNTGFVNDEKMSAAEEGMTYLRGLQRENKLRIRRLVTFGSPISLVMFRNDTVVEMMAKGEQLDAGKYGLTGQLPGDRLSGPRWLNLWDKDDPIAWPVAPAMDEIYVKDLYVDVSDSIATSHNKYWSSRKAHKVIAEHW